MGLCYMLPNNSEQIKEHGGVVIATNEAKEIIITLLPTGGLHGFPVTSLVYKVTRFHNQDVMSKLQKEGVENGEYSLLNSRQVLSDFEQNGIITKVGDFNYHLKDVERLVLGYPKEVSVIVAGLGAAIEREATYFDNLDDDKIDLSFNENKDGKAYEYPLTPDDCFKTKQEDDGFAYNNPLLDKFIEEQKTKPMETIKAKSEIKDSPNPIDFTEGEELSFRKFLTTILGFLNKYPGEFTIQETEAGNITMLINSPILPQVTFTGTIKEMADEFMPSFIETMTKKKSDLDYIASLERLVEQKKEEVTNKAQDKKKPKAKEEEKEDKNQKTLF